MSHSFTTDDAIKQSEVTGKRVLITGASSGMGLEIARIFALNGAKVDMLCRNQSKSQACIDNFSKDYGSKVADNCSIVVCDLSLLDSLKQATATIQASNTVYDLVFLNAGVFSVPYQLTEDGNEFTYAANYLGHFFVLHQLLEHQKIATDARVITTISEGAYMNPFSKADISMIANPECILHKPLARMKSRTQSSPNSKIFMLHMMAYYAEKLKGTAYEGIKFDGGDPGATLTDNINQMGPVIKVMAPMLKKLMKPTSVGAAVLVHLATRSDGAAGKVELYNHKLKSIALTKAVTEADLDQTYAVTLERLQLSPLSILNS